MKNYLCSVFLLCSISFYGYDNKLQTQNSFKWYNDYQITGYFGRKYPRIDFEKYDNDDEEYIGNPDFDAKIERPCPVYDLNCIRKFFAEHSKCEIRRGPLPGNLFLDQVTLYFPRVNFTEIPTNVRVGGFKNARIEEFYINRRTNKMVISIHIRGLFTVISTSYFKLYRSAEEPTVVVTEARVFNPSVTFTTIIPNIEDLQLDKAEITAYADTLPVFFVGPQFLYNMDSSVNQTLVEFLTVDVPTATQDVLMFTESQFLPPAYIQYNICDFGLRVLPVDTLN